MGLDYGNQKPYFFWPYNALIITLKVYYIHFVYKYIDISKLEYDRRNYLLD